MWQHYEFADFHTLFPYYSVLTVALAVGAFLLYPADPFKETKDHKKVEEEVTETDDLIQSTPRNIATELGVIHENLHHHFEHHIQSIAYGPSLKIEQPLNSGLRTNYMRTDSFIYSKEVMDAGDPEAEVVISLKKQPFFKELCSAIYLRPSFFSGYLRL